MFSLKKKNVTKVYQFLVSQTQHMFILTSFGIFIAFQV